MQQTLTSLASAANYATQSSHSAMEKLETGIFDFNGKRYLTIIDYYSRYPRIRLQSNITANTICNHFTSVLSEYPPQSSDFGPQ